MFIIFTFVWVGWQTDKEFWANSLTTLIWYAIYVSAPTSEAQELSGLGLIREMDEKYSDIFRIAFQILKDGKGLKSHAEVTTIPLDG